MRTEDSSPDAARELAAIDDALAGRAVEPDLTELGELALALREERPEMTADFAYSLDTREWGSREKSRSAKWLSWGYAPVYAATLLLTLVVSVAALNGGGDDSAVLNSGSSGQVAKSGEVAEDEAVGGAGGGSSGSEDSSRSQLRQSQSSPGNAEPAAGVAAPQLLDEDSPARNRKVEQSATITLAVRPRDVDSAADKIMRITNSFGGFVRTSSVSSTRTGGGGEFELRIPTARLERALGQLSKVGRVRERSQSSQDITGLFVSARESLTDARAERRALLRALARATTLNETESIRARLRATSQEIAAAKRELQSANNRANYSSVLVTLFGDRDLSTSKPDGDDDSKWTPADALRDAGRILEVAAGVALIALALLIPLGLLALAAALSTSRLRRTRRERALDTA